MKFISGNSASLSELIFRKKAYLQAGFRKFPLAWCSDDVAVLEFSNGSPVYFIEEGTVSVRISDKSISGNNSQQYEKELAMYQMFGIVLNKYYKELPTENLHKWISSQINFAYKNKLNLNINLFRIYWHLRDFPKLKKAAKVYYYITRNRV